MAGEITVQTKGLDEAIKRLTAMRDGLKKAERVGVEKAAAIVLNETKKGFARGGRPGKSDPNKITSRSGKLAQSLGSSKAEQKGGAVQVRVGYREGVVSRYAKIHEKKGTTTITPKRAKVLAIPLPAAMTPGGSPRFGSPRQASGFWVTTKKGNLVFLEKSTGLPLFVGKKSVKVHGRRPLGKAFERTAERRLNIIRSEIERVTAKANG